MTTMTTYDLARQQGYDQGQRDRTADEGNDLVDQKNFILEEVRAGRLLEAARYLRFAAPLWAKLGYGYKTVEIKRLVREEADAAMDKLHHSERRYRHECMTAKHIVAGL